MPNCLSLSSFFQLLLPINLHQLAVPIRLLKLHLHSLEPLQAHSNSLVCVALKMKLTFKVTFGPSPTLVYRPKPGTLSSAQPTQMYN